MRFMAVRMGKGGSDMAIQMAVGREDFDEIIKSGRYYVLRSELPSVKKSNSFRNSSLSDYACCRQTAHCKHNQRHILSGDIKAKKDRSIRSGLSSVTFCVAVTTLKIFIPVFVNWNQKRQLFVSVSA